MNWEMMFPSRFLKSAEFAGKEWTFTIAKIELEDLPDEKQGTKKRGIVSFKETARQWVINRTNATALKFLWGVETKKWEGQRVTLYAAPFTDPFTGEHITAIRVRGSPDLAKPLQFEARIGRKQVKFRLVNTAKPNGAHQSSAAPEADDGMDFDPLTGEITTPEPSREPGQPDELERVHIAIREEAAVQSVPMDKASKWIESATTLDVAKKMLESLRTRRKGKVKTAEPPELGANG